MHLLVRNALVGASPWTALLAAGIAIPILVITMVFVRDIDRATLAAHAERSGIARLAALMNVLRDASGYRRARACGEPAPPTASIDTDVATMSALERTAPFADGDWEGAAAVWRAGGDPFARASELANRISPLFVRVADRSGITYDPEVAGINLADALAYRLPRAIVDLQRIEIRLCSRRRDATADPPLFIARLTGSAGSLLNDAFFDIAQAAALDGSLPRAVLTHQQAAAAAAAAEFASLERFERHPADAAAARAARRTVQSADANLYALTDAIAPALDRIERQRITALGRRRRLTLIPGLLAMVAGALFVVLAARTVLQRAELIRMKRTAQELEYHALHDPLTGLPNRTAFVRSLEETLAGSPVAERTVAVLFIDLDNFKLVNDSLGHAAGDRVLRVVAERLAQVCADAGGVIMARFGGDEFAMLLRGATSAALSACVEQIVGSIQNGLAQPVALEIGTAGRIVVSASVGIASPEPALPSPSLAADLLRDADVAMYEAKSRGRGRAATFGPTMRERAVRKLHLTNDLRGAADRGEFVLAREPIVRLDDDTRIGYEALIRWQHPRLGRLGPGKFLPIAEESGAIVGIGRWVLSAAVADLNCSSGRLVHINLTAHDLLEETLPLVIRGLLDRYSIGPRALAIEITEGSIVRSGDRAEETLRRLRALGLQIWIDDFGIEYSSLRYLDRLPVDGVKIDRSFVGGADGNLASPPIVKMILELAASLGLDVIAEGIETTRQRDALVKLGCRYGQGYLYAYKAAQIEVRPAPIH